MQETTKLGDLIDAMYDLREDKRMLEAQLKTVSEQLEAFDRLIQLKLDEVGSSMARGQRGSASISEQEVFQIGDAENFFRYLADNQAWHLVQRRPASNAIKELKAMGEEVPGITSFVKRSISLRKI
jgi:hypothetical protein